MSGIFSGTCKVSEIHISGSVNNFTGAQPHSHVYIVSLTSFVSQWQMWEVPARTRDDPQSLKDFLSWAFAEVCWPLVKRFGNSLLNRVTLTVSLLSNFSPLKVLKWFCRSQRELRFAAAFPALAGWRAPSFCGMFHARHILSNTNLGNVISGALALKAGMQTELKGMKS